MVPLPGAQARVFLGELAGSRSPTKTFSPLLGAQLDLDADAGFDIDVDPTFEHGVLCDSGTVQVDGTSLAIADLAYLSPGHTQLHVRNVGSGPRGCCYSAARRSPKSW